MESTLRRLLILSSFAYLLTSPGSVRAASDCIAYSPAQDEFLRPVPELPSTNWQWWAYWPSAASEDRYLQLGYSWNALDLTDPAQPLELATTGSGYRGVVTDGRDFWVQEPEGHPDLGLGVRLRPLAPSELETGPTREGVFVEGGLFQDLVYADGQLFFCFELQPDPYINKQTLPGIGAIDVSDPMNPQRTVDLVPMVEPNPWTPLVRPALLRAANHVLYYQERNRTPYTRILGRGTQDRQRGAVVFEVELPFVAHDYVTDGQRLFATDGESQLVSVTGADAARGTIRSQLRIPGLVNNLALHGDLLFVGFREDGLAVVDVSDPDHMVLLGHWIEYRYVQKVFFVQEQAFVECEGGLFRIDLGDMPPFAAMGFASFWTREAWSRSSAATPIPGTDALLVAHADGLASIRLESSGTFEVLADTLTLRAYRALSFVGDALVAAEGYGTSVYHLGPEGSLTRASFLYDTLVKLAPAGTRGVAIELTGTSNAQDVFAIDLGDPSSPTVTTRFHADLGALWDVVVSDGRILILGDDGIGIMPVSHLDRGGPMQRQLFHWAHTTLAVSGDYLFLGRKDDPRADVYRFVNEILLEFVARMDLAAEPTALHVDDGILYVGTAERGMWAYDVRDPSQYVELGRIGAPNDVVRIFPYRDWIVAGSGTTLAFCPRACTSATFELEDSPIELESSSSSTFLRAHPTPDTGSLSIEFGAPVGMNELTAYDLRGRRVETLWTGSGETGTHSILWRPERLPRGVYFLRLRTERGAETTKVVLTR